MQHKEAEVVWFGSRSYVDQDYASVFRNMFQIVDAKCLEDNMEELVEAVMLFLQQHHRAYVVH